MNKNANNISFEPTLSICVPTYNRKQLLRRLIESVTADVHEFTIELIVIDDGSTDNTDSLFADNEWHSNVRIVYEYQANTGRALALKRAIDKSSGQYIIIMDSDDYFISGWSRIVSTTIRKIGNDRKNGLNIIGAIFNLETPKQKIIGTRLPTSKYSLNLIELRADFYVKGDKKELICGSLLRVCTDQISVTERRVPTALLWSIIAEYGSCILVDESLAVKEYLENGMSSKLKLLKVQNPLSMLLLNRKLLISPTYKSKLYRLKASVQYVRYSFLSRKIPTIMHMRGISIPLGSLLALLDLLYLFSFLIKKSQTFNINKFRN